MSRTKWNSNFAFLMAMIGAAVGLGNIWRFPYVFFSNGQGSFLIPYLVAILVLGFPFMLLENAIGFKFKDSLLLTFKKINSKYQIIAWILMFLCFFILTYYICIVGWDLNYLFLSFSKGWGTNPEVFFYTNFLQMDNSINGLFNIVPYILLTIAIVWFLTWVISIKGIKGIAIFTSVTIPLLFILCIGLVVFDLTLPGASIGLARFFTPNWGLLLNPTVWLAAFGQILFSLSLGWGIILTYASRLPDDTNITQNSLIIILANCGFEVINAIGVFSILGFMSFSSGISFDSLLIDGSGLAFITFPQTFNILGNVGFIIAIIIFVSIFFAGLSTTISFLEPLVDTLSSSFNHSRLKVVSIMAIVGFCISTLFATSLGNFLLTTFDTCLNNFVSVFLVILECIIFAHIYGTDKLLNVFENNRYLKIGKWWEYIVKYILPVFLLLIAITGVYTSIINSSAIALVCDVIIILVLLGVSFICYSKTK